MSLQALMVKGEEGKDFDAEDPEIFGDDGMAMVDSAIAELGISAIESTDPDFIPGPQDIVISETDAAEAIALLDNFDLSPLGLKEGEARAYILPESEDAGQDDSGGVQIFVADIPARKVKPWTPDFFQALGAATRKMFQGVAVKLCSNATEASRSLLMVGRAKEVGLARKAFADALALAGFDVGWRGYTKRGDAAAAGIEAKLASYGFSVEGTNLVFKAIAGVPAGHRDEVSKLVLATLAEDLSSLNSVVGTVRNEMRQKKEYAKVQRILDLHDISEEGLYCLLTNLDDTSRLDPKGEIRQLLQVNRDFMALADDRVGLLKKAITVTVKEARLHGLAPEQITEIIEKYGLTFKAVGIPPLKQLFAEQGGKIRGLHERTAQM